jgi:hypothetical protein
VTDGVVFRNKQIKRRRRMLSVSAVLYSTSTTMPAASDIDESEASSYDSDEEYQLAQEEWEESIRQLQHLVSAVLLPLVGKWLGRRWSYWGPSTFNLLSIAF